MSLTVTLPDGKPLELADGATGADAAAAIGPGLAKAALAIEVTHPETDQSPEVQDLARPLPAGVQISIVTAKSGEDSLALIRHDAAHVLASAVMELWPGVKISIGPAIENGFYYDFEFPQDVSISELDFPAIEAKMAEHVKASRLRVRASGSCASSRTTRSS
jgi:threonyl-tRNA synthetase